MTFLLFLFHGECVVKGLYCLHLYYTHMYLYADCETHLAFIFNMFIWVCKCMPVRIYSTENALNAFTIIYAYVCVCIHVTVMQNVKCFLLLPTYVHMDVCVHTCMYM